MILIVGATGRLGGTVARRLLAEGLTVRALSRTPAKLANLQALGAEVVSGDLRDAQSLARACEGIETVFAAAHAFDSKGANAPRTVDDLGNRNLIDTARAAGVTHVVMTSIMGARADHPVDIFRYKFGVEQYLRASGLSYTILRPSAFMELWGEIVGAPILQQGKALIFGRGVNPINFVSVGDVARFAHLALTDPHARNRAIDIGGPENLTMRAVVAIFERVLGRPVRAQHIPRAMLRTMSLAMRIPAPAFARQAQTGLLMDTADMTFDADPILARFLMTLTRFEEVVRARYGQVGAQSSSAATMTPD